MEVTILNTRLKYIRMAEKVFTVSQNTLIPISLAVTLAMGGIYYESRMQTMAARIEAIGIVNATLQDDMKTIKTTYIERRELDLRLGTFEDKLDQVLQLVGKKK